MRFREMRWPCNHPVVAMLNGAEQQAALVNISAGGARLTGLRGLAPGNRLILRLLNRSLVAEVRWIRANLCGVRFTAPLKADDLNLMRQGVARAASTARHAHGLREMR